MAIYREDIVDIDLANTSIRRTFIPQMIGEGDIYANRFGVRVLRNGEPEDLTGVTCTGYFIRSDGGTIPLTGVVGIETAFVSLTQQCYAIEGQFSLAIKLTGGGVTGTMRIVDGVVSNTMTGNAVDPGTIIPSIEELIEAINEAVAQIPEDYSALENEIDYIEDRAKTTNNVLKYGALSGLLQNDGTVATSSSYMTTNFIPVEENELYELNALGLASGEYTLYRCTYNENKQFIAYALIAAETQRDYMIPTGVKFVRFSVSNTIYNGGFTFRLKKDEFHAVEGARTGMEVINKTIRCIDYAKEIGFTQGLLSTSTGEVDTTESAYVTITDYIPVKAGDVLVIRLPKAESGFTLWRALYNKNKTYISGAVINVTDNYRRYIVLPDVAYVKYCISKNNYKRNNVSIYIENDITDGEFHLMSLPVKSDMYPYTGEQLPLKIKNKAKWAKLFSYDDPGPAGKTQQGMAIYNSMLFQFLADDAVQLFDIKNRGAFIGQISLTCGHGNTACFSDEFDSADDEFPLCYVSDLDGHVYCHKITRSGATLIKTLYFYEGGSGYGYDPMFALDTDNNICYVVGNKESTEVLRTAVISKGDMSNMTENPDSTLTPEFIEQFEVQIPGDYPVLQGVKYLNGHLFLASGAYGDEDDAFITVIDIENRTVSSRIANIPAEVAKKEMEDIAFMPNPYSDNYDMIVFFRQNGYYRLSI